MINGIVIAVVGTTMSLMGFALYQTGHAYLDMRDVATELKHTNKINQLTQEHKEAQELAIKQLRSSYDDQITNNETAHKETINELTIQLMSAREDALEKPIEFGDDLIRNLIRTDCLWSKGSDGNTVQGRETCDREAEIADTTSTSFSFSTITPTFLRAWGDACRDWEDVESITDWKAEYGNFDVNMCNEALVVMTPEASIYINRFIENGRNYTGQLLDYADEQNEIIKTLMERYDDENN